MVVPTFENRSVKFRFQLFQKYQIILVLMFGLRKSVFIEFNFFAKNYGNSFKL
ncbi:hypothetical protein LEP1GSC145_0549 [Leptospira interrogans serovar Djasiman str. LT1649]|nr:hypothetical protein LEP1GSC077_0993 [Leptospira interrogans str. C10069]EMF73704.1 hypothetical protein LEP1GSC148_1415 [Leptospira interrogans serovar Canicola str. LT1962]EMM92089.1 hypothetical protein LEP1GSC145_0549 [Leptospira interrogans serovar Djasiman str. LT1649]